MDNVRELLAPPSETGQAFTLESWAVQRYEFVPDKGLRWLPVPNPQAGIREADWLHAHWDDVADERQPWVAILGNEIVARGDSPMAVYNVVRDKGIIDALITLVRPRTEPRAHRIA